MSKKITLSVIKADIGGYVGHCDICDEIREEAEKELIAVKKQGMIVDFCRAEVGDDVCLIMTHQWGVESEKIHKFAFDTFEKLTEVAKKLKMYGAGQDILSSAFSGNLKGMGPGYAEMEIEERKSEPIIVFLADKTHPGAWNLPLYKMFADPFNTIGLVIDKNMADGFVFEVHDVIKKKKITFSCPEDTYKILSFIGASGRFVIKHIFTRQQEIAAVTSTQKLSLIAGKYVGKDDPVMVVRCQSGLPAVGEVLEPFATPYLVAGWMRGSHNGPLMPVSVKDDTPTRYDGPPRVVALGFQLQDGNLRGPRDMFADISYNRARETALYIADYMRLHGPFEPHRLPLDDLEYTTMPILMERLKDRFEDLE